MIGNLIKQRRDALGLTLEQIGDYVGVSKSTVKKWESGFISNMRRDRIASLAEVLQISPSELISGSSPIDINLRDLCLQNGEDLEYVLKKLNIPIPVQNNNIGYSSESIKKLCNYFHVSEDFINKTPDTAICPCCNFYFGANDNSLREQHKVMHNKFMKAVNEFGFCWGPNYRNEVKGTASVMLSDKSADNQKLRVASVLFMQAYFSRSLANSQFSLKHIDFDEYCAALLGQKEYSKRIPSSIYESLVNEYGVNDLIPSGTYYDIPVSKTDAIIDEDCTDKHSNTINYSSMHRGAEKQNPLLEQMSIKEIDFLNDYLKLNELGKNKANEYVKDLVAMEKYRK